MKEIEGFQGYYACDDGRIWSEKTKRFLSPGDNGNGYLLVGIYRDGQRFNKYVHRIVAETFIPNPLNLPQVDHCNGCKTDNSVSNLRWVTSAENTQFAWAKGLNERTREAVRENFRKLGKANSKPVRNVETGQEFRSARDASRFLGKSDRAVAGAIFQDSRCAGYNWEYVS